MNSNVETRMQHTRTTSTAVKNSISNSRNEPVPTAPGPLRAFLRRARSLDRIQVERQGLSYITVQRLMTEIDFTAADMQRLMSISRSAFRRRIVAKRQFAGAYGLTLIGLLEFINEAEDMLASLDDTQPAADFNIQRWVGSWMRTPQQALGGAEPLELMDTPTGRACVMRILGSLQSGSYQ